MFSQLLWLGNDTHCAQSWLNMGPVICIMFLCFTLKQNEENKKKNKQAALKAAMDLEEARKVATEAAETQKDNNASLQDYSGELQDKITSTEICECVEKHFESVDQKK